MIHTTVPSLLDFERYEVLRMKEGVTFMSKDRLDRIEEILDSLAREQKKADEQLKKTNKERRWQGIEEGAW